ncbi:MAG TPA: uroporphyrinogen decarboxylase family protein [Clostridia bacterium]|nr:uroporphyrinogen decarboxylase family protein [Clostridia bacterium]
MTSRERVEAVLRHEIPDQIPNGWGGCETTGMHINVYALLWDILNLPREPIRIDTFMLNAVVPPPALRAMGGDILLVASPNMCRSPLYQNSGWHTFELWDHEAALSAGEAILPSEDGGYVWYSNGKPFTHCPPGGRYFDFFQTHDLFDEREIPKPSDLSYRRQTSDERLRALERIARDLYDGTDFSLNCGESIADLQLMPGGMLNWYDMMLNDPDTAGEYLERAIDAAIEDLTVVAQAVGNICSMLSIAQDLGDRQGITMGPDLFRRIYLPHYRRLFEKWHQITDMKINLHSCGSVAAVLGDLIDCGLDIINPVQISCAGMEPAALKARFGRQIVFYGGAYDAVLTPPHTDPETVYAQVRQNIETLGANGGYLFAGVHNTPENTPRTHIESILRAYQDSRNYQ